MTTAEKIGQMNQLCGQPDAAKFEPLVRKGRVGSFLDVHGAARVNRLQKIAVEETRLGIPLLIGYDVIHGYNTTFPIPLAEAASWDLDGAERTARIAAKEAASAGIRWTFAPMVDIARDPRWGRVAEGAGEDPCLGSAFARARVRGFQGEDISAPDAVAACVKHFAAYGLPEGGRDYFTVDMSEKTLRETYLPPYRAAVEAGVETMMSAFNDLNGVPASASAFLLRRILRDEWGFKGMVVSDWDSVGEIVNHGIALDRSDAAEKSALAGVDMDMAGQSYLKHLEDLVRRKRVPMSVVNEAVRRILRLKFRLGLFDRPYVEEGIEARVCFHPDHLAEALNAARKSIVMLKNDGGVLPLSKTLKSIALIGPLADNQRDPIGTWGGRADPNRVVTVLEGIRRVAANVHVRHAKGCEIEGGSTENFSEALRAATQSDAVVMVLGEGADMSGEAKSRSRIDLPGHQEELLKTIVATGKPVILALMSGRPLSISWAAEHVPAILECWHLGIASGTAIAEVLFGGVNPSGKLPVTFPRAVGQIPIYHSQKSSGRPPAGDNPMVARYIDLPHTPLYAFGFGLSYTTFDYSELNIRPKRILPDGAITVRVSVKNSGARDGDEVVQLYVQDVVASSTRPVKELKAFQRISLRAGETKTVTFRLESRDLGFLDERLRWRVEPGMFHLWAGPDSQSGLEGSFEVLDAKGKSSLTAKRRDAGYQRLVQTFSVNG